MSEDTALEHRPEEFCCTFSLYALVTFPSLTYG